MKAHTASLLNAAVLIAFSAWAFFTAEKLSLTALIPGVFGLALLACHPGVRAENKMVAHIAVLLTLVVFLALIMPLRGALERGDGVALFRVVSMMATSALAIVFFVKSFIDARRQRA